MKVQLTPEPEVVTQHPVPFVYVEKTGPFEQNAPTAWQQFWTAAGNFFRREHVAAMMGLSRIDPKKAGDAAYVYQAGIALRVPPTALPQGLQARSIEGGKYARFVLLGTYAQLPHAYPVIFSVLAQRKMAVREDFCIESYLNSPNDTPEDKLQTEILIPIR